MENKFDREIIYRKMDQVFIIRYDLGWETSIIDILIEQVLSDKVILDFFDLAGICYQMWRDLFTRADIFLAGPN